MIEAFCGAVSSTGANLAKSVRFRSLRGGNLFDANYFLIRLVVSNGVQVYPFRVSPKPLPHIMKKIAMQRRTPPPSFIFFTST